MKMRTVKEHIVPTDKEDVRVRAGTKGVHGAVCSSEQLRADISKNASYP